MPHKKFFSRIIVLSLLAAALACNLPEKTLENPVSQTPPVQLKESPPTVAPRPTPSLSPGPSLNPLPTLVPTMAYQPVFEPSDCAFPVPGGTNPDCGYLVVPENRAVPSSRLIRLLVAIFHSTSPTPAPDPVVFLSGGPGSSALDLANYLFDRGIGAVLDSRDLILIDQRGTGHSIPRLDCPERQELIPVLLEERRSQQDENSAVVDALNRCHDRLVGEGVDLTGYTSAQSAQDIRDLRQALGVGPLNLYGVSYGTRLGFTIMRDVPSEIRSAVLDSVYPPDRNIYSMLAPDAERSFNVLFDQCAADLACSSRHPDLKKNFYELVDQLEANPLPVSIWDGSQNRVVQVDGGLLIDVFFCWDV